VGQVTGTADWHINADEPDVLDYDTSFKPAAVDALYEANAYRSSDHDAVVVGLNLAAFDFTGFLAPVSNLPAVNQRSAGSTVPVRFSLGGDEGSGVIAAGYPQSQPINCATGAPLPATVPTPSNGGLVFVDGLYQYDWKTEKAWAGTCRQLVVLLSDGTTYRANFKFK
jgi:uncharacterized protein